MFTVRAQPKHWISHSRNITATSLQPPLDAPVLLTATEHALLISFFRWTLPRITLWRPPTRTLVAPNAQESSRHRHSPTSHLHPLAPLVNCTSPLPTCAAQCPYLPQSTSPLAYPSRPSSNGGHWLSKPPSPPREGYPHPPRSPMVSSPLSLAAWRPRPRAQCPNRQSRTHPYLPTQAASALFPDPPQPRGRNRPMAKVHTLGASPTTRDLALRRQ